jgi:signal transduction histidine kinase
MDATRSLHYGHRVRRLHRKLPLDWLIACGLIAFGFVEVWLLHTYRGPRGLTSAMVLVRGVPLLWRSRRPTTVLAIEMAAAAVKLTYDSAPVNHSSVSEVLPGLFALYGAGAYATGRAFAASAAVTVAGSLLAAYEDAGPHVQSFIGSLAFFGGIYAGTWLAGAVVGRHRDRTSDAERRAGRAEAERERRAHEAVSEERARIARELHDVVAHAISVIVLQAKGARRMLEVDPAETRTALDTIVESGEQALGEMRRLLGMLRRSDEELALSPLPSLRHLDSLVDQVSRAGLPVELHVEGEPAEVPAGVDLSAFRIVQEALTNALKHAGPAHACVTVRYAGDQLGLEITDDGRGPDATRSDGGGHGLVGMRERAALFGGHVESAARPDGGFAVRATLPLNGSG